MNRKSVSEEDAAARTLQRNRNPPRSSTNYPSSEERLNNEDTKNTFKPPICDLLRRDKFNQFAKLSDELKSIWTGNRPTDITLKVEGYNFSAHRAILVHYSPCLQRKLADIDAQTVELTRIKPPVLRALLNYMYTGDLNLSVRTFIDVFRGAKKLEMKDVLMKCAEKLRGDVDGSSLIYIYATAMKLGMNSKWREAKKRILERFEQYMRTSEFLELTCDELCCLLHDDTLVVQSEIVVFLAALNWLQHDKTWDKNAVLMMSCVRFQLMKPKNILQCFNPPIAKHVVKMIEVKIMMLNALCYVVAVEHGLEINFTKQRCKPRKTA